MFVEVPRDTADLGSIHVPVVCDPYTRTTREVTVPAASPKDEIHYFQEPIRRQFRFATERQLDSSSVLAERSPGCKHERSRSGGNAVVVIPASGSDEIHYSEQPMRRQFRFASEGQSRSSRLLAELSPVCKHELCRSASNATVMSLAAGSDELGN